MTTEISSETLKRPIDEELNDNADHKKAKVNDEVSDNVKTVIDSSNRTRKPKKVALLLCYQGKNYYGMQRNINVSTVEENLFKALLDSNIILKSEFDFPKTMKFQRAARTDKGVSAARNIVSLRIPINEICETFQEKVNNHLPSDIRVLGIMRVTQSFDAKIACDARTYSYMLPTFSFSDNNENSEEFRITGERVEQVNKFLQRYIGTHNFFNFTSGRLANDPSCKRYIMSCECGSPFESAGLEFVVIKVKGQSFMLHQIRKMVGLTIACIRNLTDSSVLERCWSDQRIDIPKAPGLGLMLEELHYIWYNSKYAKDGIHEALEWSKYDSVVDKFKEEQICFNIAETERNEKSMMQWLETLPHHTYDIREPGAPEPIPKIESGNNVDSSSSADKEASSDVITEEKSEISTVSEETEIVKETNGIVDSTVKIEGMVGSSGQC